MTNEDTDLTYIKDLEREITDLEYEIDDLNAEIKSLREDDRLAVEYANRMDDISSIIFPEFSDYITLKDRPEAILKRIQGLVEVEAMYNGLKD